MKVLIVSTNTLPASPSGPAYVAGAALKAGHTVEVFECMFAHDLPALGPQPVPARYGPGAQVAAELEAHLSTFRPDVVGICLWTHRQQVLDEAYRSGQIRDDKELFEGVNYMSPELPKEYMVELIRTLKTKAGYTVQANKPYADYP